jgi:hypothetical protein
MNYYVFWVVTQLRLVYNRRFGITYRFRLHGPSWSLKVGPIVSPETSVSNHLRLGNNPEDFQPRQKLKIETANIRIINSVARSRNNCCEK